MCAACYHGSDHLVHIQHAVDDAAPITLQSLGHGMFHLGQIGDPESLQTVGLSQLYKVWAAVQGGLGEAL